MSRQFLLIVLTGLLAAGCVTSQKVAYFQDGQIGTQQQMAAGKDITMQPCDQISIVISSKDPELASMFNLPRVTQIAGAVSGPTNYNGQVMGYTVSEAGDIDFPVLGNLHVQGLTRYQVASLVKERLADGGLLKDAVVTVDYMNLTYSVLGEVIRPGKYNIEKDKTTILEALSSAGDLTIFGKREKVFLIRTVGDTRITYQLDMRSTDIFDSPAYYVQQNDIVYVEPNNVKANQSTVNGNSARSVSLWLSVASVLTTICILIFK